MDKRLMEFNGRQDLMHPEKLPEGFVQTDQNSRRRMRGLWTPRQGLSRPQTVGKLADRIESIGYGECALKTALLLEHNGSIEGHAISKTEVTPVWLPPPNLNWFYEVPTLTILQTGDGEVTLTPASTNSYVTTFNFYRDDILLGSGTTLVDTEAVDGADYTVEAVTDSGVTSVPSLPVTASVFGTFISDNFNRADGTLTTPWTNLAGFDMKILSERVTASNTGADSLGRTTHDTLLDLPVSISIDFARTAALTYPGSGGTFAIWELRFGTNIARLAYDTNTDAWNLACFTTGGGLVGVATSSGQPPTSGTLIWSIDASGAVTFTGGGKTLNHTGVSTAAPLQPGMQLVTIDNNDVMFLDNFAAGGATP